MRIKGKQVFYPSLRGKHKGDHKDPYEGPPEYIILKKLQITQLYQHI